MFLIPVKRVISGGNSERIKKLKLSVMEGVGVFYDGPFYEGLASDKLDFEIMTHLKILHQGQILVKKASTVTAAIEIISKLKSFQTGALRIDENESIYQLPDCKYVYMNSGGCFICGPEDPDEENDLDGTGEGGICVLGGCDEGGWPGFECPLHHFFDKNHQVMEIDTAVGKLKYCPII